MKIGTLTILATAALVAGLDVAPASAAGLLNNVLGGNGGNGGLLGGNGGNNVSTGDTVSVQSGPAGNDAFANAGIGNGGGDNNNVADVNIGGNGNGSGPDASANVSGGLFGNGGLLGTGLGNGGSGVGGDGGLVAGLDLNGLGLNGLGLGGNDVTVGIGGNGGTGKGGNGNGGNGGNGGTGGPGSPGGPGGGIGGPGSGLGGFGYGNGGSGGSYASLGNSGTCSLAQGRQVLQTAAGTDVSRNAIAGWQRVYNVQVVSVRLCPSTRSQVAQILNQSGKIVTLQNAAASDPLISASLDRSSHDANDVFSIQRNGNQLVVYVF